MLVQVEREGCIYQDNVVEYLVKAKREDLLTENTDGNQVIGKTVLTAFLKLTATTVVWVKPERYWRWRVAEDEPDREAHG
jgi:hypothetical protein